MKLKANSVLYSSAFERERVSGKEMGPEVRAPLTKEKADYSFWIVSEEEAYSVVVFKALDSTFVTLWLYI